jgi:bacterioferritin-associated ferredoxin
VIIIERNQDIMDKLTKVCLCRSISRKTIKAAILEGALTADEVKKKTGASTGSCSGRRCTLKIEQLLEEHKAGLF